MRVTVGIVLTMLVVIALIVILIVMSLINPVVLVGAAGGALGFILMPIMESTDRGVVDGKSRV